jgi:hypothetical protein
MLEIIKFAEPMLQPLTMNNGGLLPYSSGILEF